MQVMALDSRDGRGERILSPSAGTYTKPLITPDGKQVLYSDNGIDGGNILLIPWSGGTPRLFSKGYLLSLWRDPADDTQWVILAETRETVAGRYQYQSIMAYRIDNPDERRKIWDHTNVTRDNFSLSRDGRAACGLLPWPEAAILATGTSHRKKQERGCWTSICPDNSYIMWVFEGPHRAIDLYQADGAHISHIDLGQAPGIGEHEVYHPRWSNHPRVICMSGPYQRTPLRSIGNGHGVEIYIGLLAPDLTRVERWLQVTSNSAGDYMPDVWVAGAEKVESTYPQAKPLPFLPQPQSSDTDTLTDRWPASTKKLLFVWDNTKANNEIQLKDNQISICRLYPHGCSRYTQYNTLLLEQGGARAETEDAQRIAAGISESHELSIELLITPAKIDTPLARILELSLPDNKFMALSQQANTLTWHTSSSTESLLSFGKLTPGAPQHLLICVSPEKTEIFINGEKAATATGNPVSPVKPAETHLLSVGCSSDKSYPWHGSMETIALYNRTMPEDEIRHRAKLAQKRTSHRSPIELFQIRARLKSISDIPKNLDNFLVEYTRALLTCTFIAEEDFGDVSAGDEFVVLYWYVFDRKPIDFKLRAGETYSLKLESTDDHPELTSERKISSIPEEESMLLSSFLETSPQKIIKK